MHRFFRAYALVINEADTICKIEKNYMGSSDNVRSNETSVRFTETPVVFTQAGDKVSTLLFFLSFFMQGCNLKDFVRYVSLNVISRIGLSFYILADTLFIANGVGSGGLTALNLVLPLWSLISGLGLMIGIGAGISFNKTGKE